MLLDELPDGPRDERQPWKQWKTTRLIQMRDHSLAWIAERQKHGESVYPVDLVVRMYERELDKRKVNPKVYDQACEFGTYEVVADAEDLA